MQVAIAKRALHNAPHCGDQCAYWQSDIKMALCMADGLGHGEHAQKAAKAAVDYAAGHLWEPLPTLFAGCDRALRHTRGVAMGIAIVDQQAGRLTYLGVGNPRAVVVGTRNLWLSNNHGIVGAGCKTLSSQTVPLCSGDLVILASDGVEEMIDLSGYDDVLREDVEQLAKRIRLQPPLRACADSAHCPA